MLKRIVFVGLSLGVVATGCGENTESPGEPDAAAAPALEPPAPGEGVQYSMRAAITAGDENEKCKFFQVGPEGMNIKRSKSLYTEGSHHLLLYTTPYTEIPTQNERGEAVVFENEEGVFDCSDGASADWQILSVIGGAQNAESELFSLPDGVALQVPANTVLILNTHYLNASDANLDADVYINLWTVPSSEVTTRAGILFFYNPFIYVPGNGNAAARFVCPIGKDITILNAQSHMHARGVDYEAFVVDADWNRVGTEAIYTSQSWDAPVARDFPGGLQISAGQSIDYRCDYQNGENREVYQGGSATDEMCMFLGAYYPYDGNTEYCAPVDGDYLRDRFLGGVAIGNGTRLCNDSFQTILSNGFGPLMMKAVTETCPSHAQALHSAYMCAGAALGGACATACAGSPSNCIGCVSTECGSEMSACSALTTCE